jgi:hypothetical protein
MIIGGINALMNVVCEGKMHVTIDEFPDHTQSNSEDNLCLDSTLYNHNDEIAGIL